MRKTRRTFLFLSVAAGSGLAIFSAAAQQENATQGMPKPPAPADPHQQDKNAQAADPKLSEKMILRANEKEFRAGVDRLYQMAGEVKDELERTPTTEVLSVRMYKKMQEIEKLAKQLMNKAKG